MDKAFWMLLPTFLPFLSTTTQMILMFSDHCRQPHLLAQIAVITEEVFFGGQRRGRIGGRRNSCRKTLFLRHAGESGLIYIVSCPWGRGGIGIDISCKISSRASVRFRTFKSSSVWDKLKLRARFILNVTQTRTHPYWARYGGGLTEAWLKWVLRGRLKNNTAS